MGVLVEYFLKTSKRYQLDDLNELVRSYSGECECGPLPGQGTAQCFYHMSEEELLAYDTHPDDFEDDTEDDLT